MESEVSLGCRHYASGNSPVCLPPSPNTHIYSFVIFVTLRPGGDQASLFSEPEGVGSPVFRADQGHGLLGASVGVPGHGLTCPGHSLLREGGHCPL